MPGAVAAEGLIGKLGNPPLFGRSEPEPPLYSEPTPSPARKARQISRGGLLGEPYCVVSSP